jgi:hypothetical protein
MPNRLLLLTSLILLTLVTPARANEITLPDLVTFTAPSDDWVLPDESKAIVGRITESDHHQQVHFLKGIDSCDIMFQLYANETLQWSTRPYALSSAWDSRALKGFKGEGVLCLALDDQTFVVSDFRVEGSLDEIVPLLAAVERALRNARGEYESHDRVYLAASHLNLEMEMVDWYWRTQDSERVDTVWRSVPADPARVSIAAYPTERTVCSDLLALTTGAEDSALQYEFFGTGVRLNDGTGVVFCGAAADIPYLVTWAGGDLTATGAAAEIMRALVRTLEREVREAAATVSSGSYASSDAGTGDVPVDPPPTGGGGGDGLTVRSSLIQPDVRAGVAFLSPPVGEEVKGYTVGASVPPRFHGRHLVVEGDVIFMHGGDVGTMLEVHAGVGIGERFGGFEVAWTGGLGATGLGHLDDGGREEGGGPHVYTGPYARFDNEKFALSVEGALILGGHPDQSRVRVELTTATWVRKLGVAVERTQAIDGSAITVSLAVGLF